MHNLQTPITMKTKNKNRVPSKVEPKTETPTAPAAPVAEVKEKITPDNISALKGKIKDAKAPVADAKNTDAALQKIQYERDLKYLYPADCITTVDRKVFRQKTRNTVRRLEAQALKLEGKAKELKMAEIMVIRTASLVDPNATV